ncbi:MAG: SDR family oxidoreductase [Acetobacteraceae bacterium]|nr:SDR family oxidoreductase [Acetobacteraceae bacterium]
MEINLAGRAALITGGSKGLGLAMAQRMSASGADVAILARRQDVIDEAVRLIAQTAKGKVLGITCDVSRADDIARAFAVVSTGLGKVDILVNNAGQSQAAPFTEITDDVWQQDLDLKLFASIRLCRLAMPGMMERRWGRIINVLNLGAKAPKAGGAPTAVSRAAGMALTKVLANEGAPYNVLVNGMLVGTIRSDQSVRRHSRLVAEGLNESYEDYVARLGTNIPLGRLGKAEEFAALACFLASEQGGYITGTAINVDGGTSPVV